MVNQLINSFYIPTVNCFLTGNNPEENIFFWIYLAVLCSLLIVTIFYILKLFLEKRFLTFDIQQLLKSYKRILFIIIFLIMFPQTINQFQFLNDEFLYNKLRLLYFSEIKQFAELCQTVAPGKQQADFITDMNTNADPGMYIFRLLAYHLYPIDIRDVRPNEKKYLIIFQKENGLSYVSSNYSVAGQWNSENLIAQKILLSEKNN
jgi:hypothetical protein